MLGPTLETDRLVLRPPLAEDLDGFAVLMGSEESSRFIGGVQPRPVAWRILASVAGAWALNGFGMFSVIEKSTGQWVGRLGPWQPEGWPGQEIGWALVKSAWGKGYATEGAAAAMGWAFDSLNWTETVHGIYPENHPSKAVARRLGSRFIRMDAFPPPHDDHPIEIWGQSRSDWQNRRR